MNNIIVALMLITSQGASEVAQFDSMEACEAAKSQITKNETFCYLRKPVDMDQVVDHMTGFLDRMKEKMDKLREEDKNCNCKNNKT